MCHNAPWLSALDKQMRLQFVPKMIIFLYTRFCYEVEVSK